MPEKIKIKCSYCKSTKTKKGGKRKNKHQTIQIYFCKDCKKYFSDNTKRLPSKTYPPTLILKAISFYNLGNSQQQASELLAKKHKLKIPQRTISQWVSEFKKILPYSKIREQCKKIESPETIIEEYTFLHNNLPYKFQMHKAKLYFLFHNIKYNNMFINLSKFYEPIKNYLEKIPTKKFPHHIFKEKIRTIKNNNAMPASEQSTSGEEHSTITSDITGPEAVIAQISNINPKNKPEQRASQLKFPILEITKLKKQNLANKLAKLALNLAKSNKDKHQAVQDFMLINDSTTIATEIPVYLTNDDIKYFQKRGFTLNFNNAITAPINNKPINNATSASEQSAGGEAQKTITTDLQSSEAVIAQRKKSKIPIKTPITGHIDILQIRNGLIHILDYKPEADKIQPIEQLTIYALALASRTKLDLRSFKCAWFDENNYYEFFPLHAVYKNRNI